MRFKDREEAGRLLANELQQFRDEDDLVIVGLPRGGVPVAYVIARELDKPLDIFLVSKIGAPLHEEFAIGAMTSGGEVAVSEEIIKRLNISDAVLSELIESKKKILQERKKLLMSNRKSIDFAGKTIVIVDDGLATGATMAMAISSIKKLNPREVIVAVPVASQEAINFVKDLADEVIALHIPEYFYSVSAWYEDFRQTTDGEVINLLNRSQKSLVHHGGKS